MTLIRIPHRFAAVACIAGAALLAGCASFHTVSSSVASYGSWPANMTPGTYTFDRLPSQQANLARQQSLEAAAAQALGAAGFRPAADGDKPAVTVQVGARIERFEADPWDDPFWAGGWRHRYGYPGWYGPYGPGPGPWGWGRRGFWGPGYFPQDVFEREVALLIRDAATGKPLYETRAANDGNTDGGNRMLAAMFDASMRDFPGSNEKPHDIVVDLTMVPPATPAMVPAAMPPAPAASAS